MSDGNELISRSIEKGRQSRFAFQKFLNIDYCLLLFCIINVMLSMMYYDADYAGKTNISNWCLLMSDFISAMQSNFVYLFSHHYLHQVQIINRVIKEPKNFIIRINYPQLRQDLSNCVISGYFVDSTIFLLEWYKIYRFQT